MFFPLRDEIPSRSTPFVTVLLIAANVSVFFYQAFLGPLGFERYVISYGLIPARFVQSDFLSVTILTSIFMHGSFFHLLSNMWFLWIFGDNLEDALGHVRFLVFYLLTGLLASLAHVSTELHSQIPLVGASGAIAGILGGYFLLFPHHRIVSLVFLFFFFTTVRIHAAFFLAIWFLTQIVSSPMGGGVAWFAHIGGFVAGLLGVRLFLPRRTRRTYG